MNVDVVVVGGGIAGLATAYELHRRHVSFVVLERASRPGGVIFSEEIDGFTIDAGPDSLLVQKPDGIKLCEEIGLGDRLVATKPPRIAFIQRAGVLHPLPAASVLGIPTRVGPFVRTRLFSWPGKLRMGAELFVPARRDQGDESIGQFVARRFGREAATYLAEPLLAGIHAGDVDRLSLRALFPRLADAERQHGSLLRAFRQQRSSGPSRRGPEDPQRRSVPDTRERHGASVPASEGGPPREANDGAFRSLAGGLGEMVGGIVRLLPRDAVRVGTEVTRIGGNQPFTVEIKAGEILNARAIVLATPAYITASLVQERDAELARLCDAIHYASTATVTLAFSRAAVGHPLDGSGYVVPRTERNGILAASWLSSKWPNRAPEGRVLLRTFIGGARDPQALDRSDADLVARSLAAIGPILQIQGAPLVTRVYRFERANAQHEVGHLTRLDAIERAVARHPGLFVTGSGLRGVGIPDCVADGRATAGQVAEWLEKEERNRS
ncbi:MAG: protoporphyrinogen oxidase [Acidobacteria bacterium RIFCSPLOWO2_02_FULL_64_15]|nr:MAG: protoporphyrinogen oxidase [Acidobacteria bacterium RIFCSPLOWO2_02_FULL_64_15]